MGKNKEKLQSKVVDFLRFPLMIGVVIIHSRFTIILQPQMLEYVQTGGIDFYVSWLFSKVIFGICVFRKELKNMEKNLFSETL